MTDATQAPDGPPISEKDLSIIEQFKVQAQNFWRLFLTMDKERQFVGAQNKSVQREYAALMKRGQKIRVNVERVTGIIDRAGSAIQSAKNWFTGLFGIDGYNTAQAAMPPQLGLIPLIPIAVVAAALALIGKWVNDAVVFNRRIAEMKRLQAQGLSPTEAARVVNSLIPVGILTNIRGLMMPVALIAAVVLIPKLLPKGKSYGR